MNSQAPGMGCCRLVVYGTVYKGDRQSAEKLPGR